MCYVLDVIQSGELIRCPLIKIDVALHRFQSDCTKSTSLAHPSTPSLKPIIAETTQIVPPLNEQRQLIEIGQ